MVRSRIIGTGSSVPAKVLYNKDFEKLVDTSNEWIMSRTGIMERHIAADGECSSTFGYRAALSALEMAGTSPEELDMIIVGTISPDMPMPSVACFIQHKLKALRASAFDVSAGCTGFLYSLTVADAFIRSGTHKKILVIGAETLSKFTDYQDRTTCVLFGDGAGAVVLTASESGGVLDTYIAADGTGAAMLTSKALPSINPICADPGPDILDSRPDRFIAMDGKEVYKFAVSAMPDAMDRVLASAGHSIGEVDHIIPHQANARIIESVIAKYRLDPAKVLITLDKYGNTSSASIPIGLDELNREGKLKRGDLILVVGFGAGLTYASALIQW